MGWNDIFKERRIRNKARTFSPGGDSTYGADLTHWVPAADLSKTLTA